MPRPQKVLCDECGKPVTCGQGTRHLECSPICRTCWEPIPSKAGTEHKCTKPSGRKGQP